MLQLFLIICTLLFGLYVVILLVKNKIGERNSAIWLGVLAMLFLLVINPSLIEKAAEFFGISYPPSLVFFLAVLVLLSFSLYQTVQLTRLSKKVKDITQYLALHADEKPMNKGGASDV